jgi:class 3 adenylate cyclase/tetratricopeptide (TPR) repeat protein
VKVTCVSCGNELAPGARFCAYCGNPTRTASEERRVVTVLFADLVGFTGLSEALDPEQVKHLVDAAFQRLVGDVVSFGGRVDKILGDAIIALFGAPTAHEDDAERAVRAALRMQATLNDFAEQHGESIRMRIGVNTGEVLVGSLRAGGDYTAMGDVVNIAARLQTAADPGTVLVGELTFRATEDVIGYESKGALFLRGRANAVNVWRPTEPLTLPGMRPKAFRLPMIGRDRELAVVGGTVSNSIVSGRAQMVLLLGDAGVGKSRFASELAEGIRGDHEALVYAGRCVPYGEANVWWPLAEVLREGCGLAEGDGQEVAEARVEKLCQRLVDPKVDGIQPSAVAAGLLHVMGFDSPLRALDPMRSRSEATDALVSFLKASARNSPIVVRLIDLHWADDSILALIDDLLQRLARMPVVLLATARRSLIRRWSPRIGRFNALVLNIEPLDPQSAHDLVRDMTLGADLDEATIQRVLERAGGNPLFLEELVRFFIKHRDGDIDVVEIPDSLRGLVAARIDALAPDEQAVVEDASVWGPSGSIGVLQRLGAVRAPRADVTPIVNSLADKEIMALDRQANHVDWTFRSDVVREVAYGRLTKTDRMARHRGIAEYLATSIGDRYADDSVIDLLARHFTEAASLARSLSDDSVDYLDEQSIRWTEEAIDRAKSLASWRHVVRLYDRLIDISAANEGTPEHSERAFGFHLGRARASIERWDLDAAQADLTTAGRLASAADSDAAAWVKVVRAELERRRGNLDRSQRYAESAMEQFVDGNDLPGQAEAGHVIGVIALFQGEWSKAESAVNAALAIYEELDDRSGRGWALQHLAWTAFAQGRIEVADARIDAAMAAFEEFGDRTGVNWSLGLRSWVLILRGERAEAERLARGVLGAVEAGIDPWGEAMMLAALGAIHLWNGATTEAVDLLSRSSQLFESLAEPFGIALSGALLGRATVMTGAVEEGLDLIDRAAKLAGPSSRYHVNAKLVINVLLGKRLSARSRRAARANAEKGLEAASVEATFAAGLSAVATGATAEAAEEINWAKDLPDLPGSAIAVLALIDATSDIPTDPTPRVEIVLESESATYMDRMLAQIALVIWHSRQGNAPAATLAARDAASTANATEDHLAKAISGLFLARAAMVEGADGAEVLRELNEKRWNDLGVKPKAWGDLAGRYFPQAEPPPSRTLAEMVGITKR